MYVMCPYLSFDVSEKRHKKVINETVSLVIQATLTILRELGLIYNKFNIANMAHTSINQDYLKPKVKELLKLFASSRGKDLVFLYVANAI